MFLAEATERTAAGAGTLSVMANALELRSRLMERPGFARALSGDLHQRLIQPLLLFSGDEEERRAIPFLPGQYLLSLTEAVREARAAARAGIAGVALFGAPDRHDESALLASQHDWLVPRAIRAIKDAVPELGVATDVCVCAYVSHGQCVLFREGGPDLQATRARLAEIAVAHAQAGADFVVLSGMLDGAVGVVRSALDGAAFRDVAVAGIAKFATTLYSPYRHAVGMARIAERAVPLLPAGDRAGALARGARDVVDGADLVIVTPGLTTLDVVAELHHRLRIPVGVFHVAGEFALLRAAGAEGDIEETALFVEAAQSARRAGGDLVFTYAAIATAELLEEALT